MLNPNSIASVWFADRNCHRKRNCVTTVYPPGQERRDIVDPIKRGKGFNSWNLYVKAEVFASSAGEQKINELTRILNLEVK